MAKVSMHGGNELMEQSGSGAKLVRIQFHGCLRVLAWYCAIGVRS